MRLRELARVSPRLWRSVDRVITVLHTDVVERPAKKGGA
jgi:hypothetical protein